MDRASTLQGFRGGAGVEVQHRGYWLAGLLGVLAAAACASNDAPPEPDDVPAGGIGAGASAAAAGSAAPAATAGGSGVGEPTSGAGAPAQAGMMAPVSTAGTMAATAGTMAATAGTMAATAGTTAATAGTMAAMAGTTAATAGTMAATAGTMAPTPSGDGPTDLPTPTGSCQDFRTGTMTFKGVNLQIWAGSPPASAPGGPLVFYWHGTGTTSGEAVTALGSGIEEVVAEGGIVASFIDTTGSGRVSGGTIWYNDDLTIADEVVACAIEKHNIDPRRIHSSGYSAGGLQSGAMMYQRSNYLASALIYSGGVIAPVPNADPSNAPAVMCAHGAPGSDWLALDFAEGCMNLGTEIAGRGGFAIDCNDGGGHIALSRFGVANFGWQFLKSHRYKSSSPWASMLPANAPDHCEIWQGQ